MEIKYIKTAELIPYARNSRTHSEQQVQQIASSIKEFGFTNPVLIDDGSGIIAGHGRVMAAQLLKLDEVPTITLKGLTDTQKRAYIIADNKIALNAGWNTEMLEIEMQDLYNRGFDLDLTGFDMDELLAMDINLDLDGEDEKDEVDESLADEDYSHKNKEINTDDYKDIMELKFKLTFSEYEEAREKLKEIANSPENALKILLKMEI